MTISHLPNIPWSPEAAIGDAMNNAKEMDCVIVIWVDKNDEVHSRAAGCVKKDVLWLLEAEKNSLMSGD